MAVVIAIATSKGGVGKTTVSVALAEAAALGGASVTLIDCDPQGSAIRWAELAAAEGRPFRSAVVAAPAANIGRYVAEISRGAVVVVIDTPPPGVGTESITVGALRSADFTVMPVPPEGAALDRIQTTARAAGNAGVPAAAVLTMTRSWLIDRHEAIAALGTWGVPVLAVELPLRADVQRNYGHAVAGTLARFGVELMTELADRMTRNAR